MFESVPTHPNYPHRQFCVMDRIPVGNVHGILHMHEHLHFAGKDIIDISCCNKVMSSLSRCSRPSQGQSVWLLIAEEYNDYIGVCSFSIA